MREEAKSLGEGGVVVVFFIKTYRKTKWEGREGTLDE